MCDFTAEDLTNLSLKLGQENRPQHLLRGPPAADHPGSTVTHPAREGAPGSNLQSAGHRVPPWPLEDRPLDGRRGLRPLPTRHLAARTGVLGEGLAPAPHPHGPSKSLWVSAESPSCSCRDGNQPLRLPRWGRRVAAQSAVPLVFEGHLPGRTAPPSQAEDMASWGSERGLSHRKSHSTHPTLRLRGSSERTRIRNSMCATPHIGSQYLPPASSRAPLRSSPSLWPAFTHLPLRCLLEAGSLPQTETFQAFLWE